MDEAIKQIEKSNIDLEPELLDAPAVRELLSRYAKAEKLVSYGKTMLAAKLDDTAAVARATGVSLGKAKAAVNTGNSLKSADEVRDAFKSGEISLDQATEIARAEQSCPGSSPKLLKVAQEESFQALRERSRKVVLEAEQHRGLAERQHEARRAHSYQDELGMININLLLEPHVGVPIVNRAESEAGRRFREAKKTGRQEPFERHLADAYAGLVAGGTEIKARKPELVVLVSYEIATRGWNEVQEGEVCKIPGVGPISPERAKETASDAFLSGLFYDGTDLRHFRRWTRNTPVEVCRRCSSESRRPSTGSSASIAAAAFETRRNIASLMSPEAWHRPPISSGVAMGAIRERPQRIGRMAGSHLRTRMPNGDRRGRALR